MDELTNFVHTLSFSRKDEVSGHICKLLEGRDRAPDSLNLLAPVHCHLWAGGSGHTLTCCLFSPQPQRRLPAPSRPPCPHPSGAGPLSQREHGGGQQHPGLGAALWAAGGLQEGDLENQSGECWAGCWDCGFQVTVLGMWLGMTFFQLLSDVRGILECM